MGILDKLTKKKEQQQEDVEKTREVVSDIKGKSEKKPASKKTTSKSKKETKETKEKVQETVVSAGAVTLGGDAYKVLIRPIVSEKAALSEANGVYTFEVDKSVNKVQVKNAIRQVYGVTPKKVRIMNMDGKKVRFGRHFGRRDDWKKAFVTLPKGTKITIHEGV